MDIDPDNKYNTNWQFWNIVYHFFEYILEVFSLFLPKTIAIEFLHTNKSHKKHANRPLPHSKPYSNENNHQGMQHLNKVLFQNEAESIFTIRSLFITNAFHNSRHSKSINWLCYGEKLCH